jgi:hypothetical protein
LLGGKGTVNKAELVGFLYKLDWPAEIKNFQEVEFAFDNHVSSAVEAVKINNLISNSPFLPLQCSRLEGIRTLCKESVLDMRTTAKVFAPKCGKDKRPWSWCSTSSSWAGFRLSVHQLLVWHH